MASSRNGVTCNHCSTRLKNKSSLPLHLSSVKCRTQRELNRNQSKQMASKRSEASSDLFRKVPSTTESVEKQLARIKLKGKSLLKSSQRLGSTLSSSLTNQKNQKNFSTSFQHGPAMFRQPQESSFSSKPKEQKAKALSKTHLRDSENENEDEVEVEDDHIEVDPDFQDSEELQERDQKTQVNLDEAEEDVDQEQNEEDEDESIEKGLRFDEEPEPEGNPSLKNAKDVLSAEDKIALLGFWKTTYQFHADPVNGLNFFNRIKSQVSSYQNTSVSQKVVSELKKTLLDFIEGAHKCILKFWDSLEKDRLNFSAGKDVLNQTEKEALEAVHQWWRHKHLILGNEYERQIFEDWQKEENRILSGGKEGILLTTLLDATLALLWLNKKFHKIEKTVCFFLKHPMPIHKDGWKLPSDDFEKRKNESLHEDLTAASSTLSR